MKRRKMRRVGALLLVMMMLFTTLPATARAETRETEGPGVEESANAAPETEKTSENADNGESIKEDAMPEDEATVSGVRRAPAPTNTKDLTVKVTLDTTMKMIMDPTQSYTFLVNGKEYEIRVTSPTGLGPVTFTATFHDVPFQEGQAEADVELERLPKSIADYYTVVEQNYDSNTKTLRVVLGRDFYIKVSNIKDGTKFDDLGTMNIPGFELTLYDNNQQEIKKVSWSDLRLGILLRASLRGCNRVNIILRLRKFRMDLRTMTSVARMNLRLKKTVICVLKSIKRTAMLLLTIWGCLIRR